MAGARALRGVLAEAAFDPVPFDAAAARAFGQVAASLCLANNLPVYTCNVKDFRAIDGLDVVAVPTR